MTREQVIERYKKDRDLSGTDLRGLDLGGIDLRWCNLCAADLRGTDLRWTDLRGADLRWADLQGADLRWTRGIAENSIVPQLGAFHAFKRLRDGTVVELLIPADAERVGGLTGRICRASKATIIGSCRPDAILIADNYDPFPGVEVSSGIHFFITREEAEAYGYDRS